MIDEDGVTDYLHGLESKKETEEEGIDDLCACIPRKEKRFVSIIQIIYK